MSAPRRRLHDSRFMFGPASRPAAILLWFEVVSRVVRFLLFVAAVSGGLVWWLRSA